jgi:sugar phosphate isomerase/epimerase
MFLNSDSDIKRLDGYIAAKPNLKIIAGLYVTDHAGRLKGPQLNRVIAKLAEKNAALWLIMKGKRNNTESIVKRIQEIADLAAKKKVPVCLYPHDGDTHTYTDAEEALVYLKKANRPNLCLSVHLCHELRAGNGKRLDEVIAAVQPHITLASISGANHTVTPGNRDWSDTIRPLSEGDFDTSSFVGALEKADYKGAMILHTFGLQKRPVTHHSESLKLYQKMCNAVTKSPTATKTKPASSLPAKLRVATGADLPFPADTVWKLIAGFNTLPDYHASITSSELSEGGVVRKIGLTEEAGGGYVVERLVYFNDVTREFSYQITDLIDCDFPLRNYQAFVRLKATGENSCRLNWGSNFTVEGATDKEGDELARIIYQGCYDGIKRTLNKKQK